MYNKAQITEAFRGVIGVKPTADYGNTRAALDQDITTSTHDSWVNEYNKLFSVENFVDSMDNYHWFELKPYSVLDSHRKYDIVEDDDKVYECIQNTSSEPLSNDEYWRETTLLSVRFREIIMSSVHDTFKDFLEIKKVNGYGKTLKGVTSLYNGSGARSNIIQKSGRFVGYYIRIKEDGIIVKLNRMGLQLSASHNVPIYLYDSSSVDELATWTFNHNNPNKFSYADIPNNLTINSHEGYYVIGYYEDDLPDGVNSIQLYNNLFVQSGCGSCSSSDLNARSQWSSYLDIYPMSVDDAESGDGMVWGVEDMKRHEDTNFGINLSMTFLCDMTRLFIDQKDSFIPAIESKITIKLLQELALTSRNNNDSDENQVLAYNVLMNENPKVPSPFQVYEYRLKGLEFELSGINRRCLPDKFDGQISWGVV